MNIRSIRSAKLFFYREISGVKRHVCRYSRDKTSDRSPCYASDSTPGSRPHSVRTLSPTAHLLDQAPNASGFRVLTLNLVNVRLSVHYIFLLSRVMACDRLLTGTCNGHEHLSPLRSSHASLLEPARRKGNLDAKNRDCTAESGRTSVDTESLSCGAALLWGALDKDRATMAHQCSFDGGVMLVREFWSEFSCTVFRIRR